MNYDYTFFGRVHPEKARLNLPHPVTIKKQKNDDSFVFKYVFHFRENQLIARVQTFEDLGYDLVTLKNIITEHAQSIVDLAGLLRETGFYVEIVSGTDNSDPDVARNFIAELKILKENVEDRDPRFFDYLPILADSPYVALALAELRSAIREPADTGFHCHRAFESVQRDFKAEPTTGSKSTYDLKRLGSDLNIGSATKLKRFLGKYAHERRHGEAVFISWKERKDVLIRAWVLVDRYLEYLKRDRAPLPKKEFPVPKYDEL